MRNIAYAEERNARAEKEKSMVLSCALYNYSLRAISASISCEGNKMSAV